MPVRAVRTDSGAGASLVGGAEPVVLTGLPSEVLLYLFGRSEVCEVAVSGPDAAVARLGAADLGL